MRPPLRLLHVVPTYLPAWRHGGPVAAVHGLCKALAARGHAVTVFTTDVHGAGTLDVPKAVPVDLDGVEVWYFPVRFPRRLYRSPALGAALARQLVAPVPGRGRTGGDGAAGHGGGRPADGFDLVHLHSVFLWPTAAAARAAERAGVPYLVAPRGMLVADLLRRRGRRRKELWIRLVERRTLERAAALHVTSALEAAEIRRLGLAKAPIHVIENGVDLAPAEDGGIPEAGAVPEGGASPEAGGLPETGGFQEGGGPLEATKPLGAGGPPGAGDPPGAGRPRTGRRVTAGGESAAVSAPVRAALARRPLLLFLGRVSWKKGLDRLVAALAEVPGATLAVAGNDEEGYRAHLERLAAGAGVAGRVLFLGPVHGAGKAALLRGADLMVLPSYSENFGNVVLEAMAAALPAVVTPEVGLAPVVAESGAGLVAEGDPPRLAAALRALLADPDRRRAMGERGAAEAARRFGWDTIAARMEEVYAEILANAAGGGARREPVAGSGSGTSASAARGTAEAGAARGTAEAGAARGTAEAGGPAGTGAAAGMPCPAGGGPEAGGRR